MAEYDPSHGDNRVEHLANASEEVARALGNVTHVRGMIDELNTQNSEVNEEINRLHDAIAAATENRSQIGREISEFTFQYYNAVGDMVQRLAEVINSYDLSVSDALELLRNTTAQLDASVLDNITKQPPMWHDASVAAINPYDKVKLLNKDTELRALPEGEYIGLVKGQEVWVGTPLGAPRLKLVADTYRASQPFPYEVVVEMKLAEKEGGGERQEDSFVGNIIAGSDAIVAEALRGKRHDYRTSQGAVYEPNTLLKAYKNDQYGLSQISSLGLTEKISDERKAQVKKAIAQSHAGFRDGVAQQAQGIYAIPENKELYTKLLGSVFFNKGEYRRITDLIDTIYGDGSDEMRVKLAAYTQVLARKFEEDGKLADDVKVDIIDLRHAMYFLTRDKSSQ